MQRSSAAAVQPPHQQRKSMLSLVTKGKLCSPPRIVLYGPEKIGKSTFASEAQDVIFLGAEEGTNQLDVARLPEPRRWQDAYDSIDDLTNESHPYKALAIDTFDWLEPLCWEEVCRVGGKKSIEDFGFKTGYITALEYWKSLLFRIDRMRREKNMMVIVLAHSCVRTFKNPTGDDFDRFTMKTHEKASSLLKEWSDVVLFANHEQFAKKVDKSRAKGISTGARIVHTTYSAAWDAGSRYSMPETLPLDFATVMSAIQKNEPDSSESISEQITAMLASVDDETRAKVEQSVQIANGNPAQLARIANKLSAIVNTQGN